MIEDKKKPQKKGKQQPDEQETDVIALLEAIRASNDSELNVLTNIASTMLEIKQHLSKLGSNETKNRQNQSVSTHANQNKVATKQHHNNTTTAPSNKNTTTGRLIDKTPNNDKLAPKESTSSTITTPASHNQGITKARQGEIELQSNTTTTPKESTNSTNVAPFIETSNAKQIKDASLAGSNAITAISNDLQKFWKDEKGRLRTPTGQYANKDQIKSYEQNSSSVAKEREDQKKSSSIAKIISTTKTIIDKASGAAETDAVEAGGAAAGGTYFYAVKEIFDVAKATTEKIDAFKGDEKSGGIKGTLAKLNPFKKKADKSKTEKAKEASSKRKNVEILKEQTAQQAKDSSTTHKKLDDVVSAIKKATDSGGLLDGVKDLAGMFDGSPDIDGKKRKKKLKGKKGAKWSKPSSVMERVKNGAQSIAEKRPGFMDKAKNALSPKSIAKVGGPLAALFAGFGAYSSVKDREDLSGGQKTAQVASTAVGAGAGTAMGATIGATIGTFILPGIGTAIGGFLGGALGGSAGTEIGSTIGESISDFFAREKSDSATPMSESDAFKAKALERRKSEADARIKENMSYHPYYGGGNPVMAKEASNDNIYTTASNQSTPSHSNVRLNNGYQIQNSYAAAEKSKASASTAPTTVSLDSKSLDALNKAGNKPSSSSTSYNNNYNTTNGMGPASMQIPDDFNSRDLRRQAADLE